MKKREKYWNEDYTKYWKKRVDEANNDNIETSNIVAKDSKTTTDEVYLEAISLLKINKEDKIIELGAGFGRSLSLLCSLAKHVSALDISDSMLELAKKNVEAQNIDYYVSPSEETPFENNSFNVAICFAAFDAMYQTNALIEINRICKNNGKVLITGKNDNYRDDDKEAFDAEIGARKKNHPNYFTDVVRLIDIIESFGFKVLNKRFFIQRGDFGLGVFTTKLPEHFYEFLFILEKVSKSSIDIDKVISCSISKTFNRISKKFSKNSIHKSKGQTVLC